MSTSTLRVAVVGAGPAGIYAADILAKQLPGAVSIDILERLPAPFGLVRYGVAPDHPRIKQIIDALQAIGDRGEIRFLGNVDVGSDIAVAELADFYDAIILATGAIRDADLDIPGIEAPGSFGAADFVSWYDGHPDVPRDWPLEARQVAVIGNGNVALDVARILAKRPGDLARTDIPDNVARRLATSPVTDVHVFGRRGPAQVKFASLELRELGQMPGVDIVVYPEDFEFDAASEAAIRASNQTKQVVTTLTDWTLRSSAADAAPDVAPSSSASLDPAAPPSSDPAPDLPGSPADAASPASSADAAPAPDVASRRIHLHFLARPVEVLTADDGRVAGLRIMRTRLVGDGTAADAGQLVDYPVQAVYRAVGYFGSPIAGLPFDPVAGVIVNDEGRIMVDGQPAAGLYTTGWIKRGPVGLIGHTKSDAMETIRHLIEDLDGLPRAARREPAAIDAELAGRGLPVTTWQGWLALDAHERALGQLAGRDRVKVVSRQEMTAIARGSDGSVGGHAARS